MHRSRTSRPAAGRPSPSARHLALLVVLLLTLAGCGSGGDAAVSGDGAEGAAEGETGGETEAVDTGDGDAAEETADLQEALLTLNWVPYGEHAPFFYGVQEGFYADEGINLTIRAGGGSGRTIEAVAGQHTEFGWADTPALLNGITAGMPIKSVGVFLQRGPASMQFFADADISTPEDLVGKSIAGTPGDAMYATFPAWLELQGLSEADVELVNVDPAAKVSVLAERQVDVIMGFFHDQGPTIAAQTGEDVDALLWADTGMNLLSNGVVVNTELIEEDPEMVEAFLRATVRSWEAAEAEPEAAVAAMATGAEVTHDEEVLAEQFEDTLGLLHTPTTEGEAPGVNDEGDWQETIDLLVENTDVTDGPPSDFWDASFMERVEG